MWPVAIVVIATCAAFALRGTRWAQVSLRASRWTYGLAFPLSLLYFPMKAGWRLRPVRCEWTFDFALAIYSLRNTAHIVLFTIFFILTWAQIARTKAALAWSFAASFVMGFVVEMAQGATGFHHCRMRDLIPDMTGALLGALLILAVRYVLALRASAAS